jgi:hypothetical protein
LRKHSVNKTEVKCTPKESSVARRVSEQRAIKYTKEERNEKRESEKKKGLKRV